MTYLPERSKVSTLNSTASTLTSGTTFTGTWEDISQYPSLTISLSTDQNATYYIQFSSDGVNTDSSLVRYHRTTEINTPHRYTTTRKYFRITLTNTGVVSQTYCRFQTLLCHQTDLNAPIDSILAKDFDATVVRPTEFKYEVALGRRQGSTTWNKWGYNADIDIGTEAVWAYGGLFTRIDTASTFTVVSSSAQDILTSGTGAWNVVIYYIDSTRTAATVVVPLNGTTPVVTSVTGLGINRVAIYNSGSGDSNAGNITITATTGGSVQAYIPAGEGTTQQAIFFTQANHVALADWLTINVNKISGGGSPRVTIKIWVYSYISTAKYLVFSKTIDTSVENNIELTPSQPFVISESSIFWIEATSDTNNTIVSSRFSLIEFKDVDA